MAKRFINPRPQYLSDSGEPLAFGKVFIFDQGSAVLKDLFFDAEQDEAAPNPVILSGSGRMGNTFFTGTARAKLTDKDEVQFWDIDNISSDDTGGAFSTWSSTASYDIPQIVTGSDDNFYKSLTNGNSGNDPVSSPTFWEQIEFIGIWDVNITYDIDDTVRGSDGKLYAALTATAGNDPISDRVNWAQAINLDYINGTSLEATSVRQAADASLGTGTHTFDYSASDMQQLTATGDITVEFSNFVSGEVSAFTVDAVDWGAHTITLPAGLLFASGTAPAFTVSGTDRFLFLNDKDDVLTLHVVGQALAV